MPVLSLITVAPLVGAVLIMFTARRRPGAVRGLAVGSTAISLALSLWVYAKYRVDQGGFQFRESYPLVPPFGIGIELGVDGISVLMVLLTVFVSLDLFVFFLFYELAVLPMYLLIGIWGSSGRVPPRGIFGWAFRETGVGSKEYAAMKLTLYLLLGSAFILVGIFVLYFQAGAESC
jgi:NADH-quinone oxidoreductase subunit M